MGFHDDGHGELASADVALLHARLPALRARPGCPPSRQCPLSRDQFDPPLSRPAADDGEPVEKRLRGCPFRAASPSRGVGCVDRGTKRCAQHLFPDAVHGGLCPLLGAAGSEAISPRAVLFLAGPDGQIHAGHAAAHPSADGLLAAETVRRRPAADARPPGPDRGIEREEASQGRNGTEATTAGGKGKGSKTAPSFLWLPKKFRFSFCRPSSA